MKMSSFDLSFSWRLWENFLRSRISWSLELSKGSLDFSSFSKSSCRSLTKAIRLLSFII